MAIFLCVEGQPWWAGFAILMGYLFGDILDGWVARRLGTANQFGAEFDTIADHLAHCIAPGAIVYTVYRHAELGLSPRVTEIVAMVLGAALMVTASIRHARNIVRPVVFKGVWAGLPRTVLGFLAVAWANASLVPVMTGGWWIGVGLIAAICVFALTYLPFPNHHLPRSHVWYVKVLIVFFFVTTFGILFVRREFFFDVLFFWMFGYAATAWMSLTPPERKAFREAVDAAHRNA